MATKKRTATKGGAKVKKNTKCGACNQSVDVELAKMAMDRANAIFPKHGIKARLRVNEGGFQLESKGSRHAFEAGLVTGIEFQKVREATRAIGILREGIAPVTSG
jgi:hypothetical protein